MSRAAVRPPRRSAPAPLRFVAPRLACLRLALACALAAPTLASAAAPIEPIRPGERPGAGSTEAELWYGMDQAERDIKTAPALVRDPALNAYVQGVACKVAGEHCADLRVYIVDVPVFNASMAPNGAMLVFTGALLRMQDESELALVLGHEFAHYRQRHGLRGWTKAKSTSAVMASIAIIPSVVALAASLGGLASVSKFSRDMEREADRIGFDRVVGLGYDPQAGAQVWGRMLREEKSSKRSKPWPVFASHPNTAERLEDTAAAAKAHAGAPGEVGRDAYQAAMRPWLDRWLAAELSRRTYDTSIQVIADLREEAQRAGDQGNQGLYGYYLAEAYRRRGKNDDRQRSAQLLSEAVAHADAPPAAWREQAYALRERKDAAAAIDAFRRYLAAAPDAEERPFIEKTIAELETAP
ncbi:M48 family metallopeptidase [Lysobacter enzymogenes]|uniref:M48 family metallopeptidase n=1 Tax=Lysobacter enzymogenes TaxID=69 RepID=UPI002265180B|nr:M48 family metallopeptidase [Lysobacter enzymogenes]UZW62135.1 M48 family metallopeptidase [Lysobacter enzymogenes]